MAGAEMKIEINEYDREWQKVAGQTFTMQKSFFNPHDFAISKNYYVFFQNAVSFKMVRFLQLALQSGQVFVPLLPHLACLSKLSRLCGLTALCAYAISLIILGPTQLPLLANAPSFLHVAYMCKLHILCICMH